MAIESTYKDFLIEKFIKTKLLGGVSLSAADIKNELNVYTSSLDLTKPQFSSEDYHTKRYETSSAAKDKAAFEAITQDLGILYKESATLADSIISLSERWRIESKKYENRLINVQDSIENLLLITDNTEGYHSVIIDNFNSSSSLDLSLSDAFVDLKTNTLKLNKAVASVPARIHLNNLVLGRDVSFSVQESGDFVSKSTPSRSKLANIFSQTTEKWITTIHTKRQSTVITELIVKLTSSNAVPLNRITLDLFDSSESSMISITPLYSLDNQSYIALPTVTPTSTVKSFSEFTFKEVTAKFIKFILVKEYPDFSAANDLGKLYGYQFGFNEISFFNEAYNTSTLQTYISKPLFIQKGKEVVNLEKAVLESCEKVENNTEINYFLATSNDPLFPVDANTKFIPITPVNRKTKRFDSILSFSDFIEQSMTNIKPIENLNDSYKLVSIDPLNGNLIETSTSQIKKRYSFQNETDVILDRQFKTSGVDPINFNKDKFEIYRNVGSKNLLSSSSFNTVRGVSKGWSYKDPYYSTIINIKNAEGLSINIAENKSITIDGFKYQDQIDSQILSFGKHTISIHKYNWKEIDMTGVIDLVTLKAADPLYPYNQKYLIEGLEYPISWPDNEEKVYEGVYLFAEKILKKVSIFDFGFNIKSDNHNVYSLDTTASNSDSLNSKGSMVFLVKSDKTNTDYTNEEFTINFSSFNQYRKYLRLKIILKTFDKTVTPVCDAYKIKVA